MGIVTTVSSGRPEDEDESARWEALKAPYEDPGPAGSELDGRLHAARAEGSYSGFWDPATREALRQDAEQQAAADAELTPEALAEVGKRLSLLPDASMTFDGVFSDAAARLYPEQFTVPVDDPSDHQERRPRGHGVEIELSGAPGNGAVLLDGQDISAITQRGELTFGATGTPVLTLSLLPRKGATVSADGVQVTLDEMTGTFLRRLGWREPGADDEPAPELGFVRVPRLWQHGECGTLWTGDGRPGPHACEFCQYAPSGVWRKVYARTTAADVAERLAGEGASRGMVRRIAELEAVAECAAVVMRASIAGDRDPDTAAAVINALATALVAAGMLEPHEAEQIAEIGNQLTEYLQQDDAPDTAVEGGHDAQATGRD